jgi:bifunctional non-homologous end joining protein LigD
MLATSRPRWAMRWLLERVHLRVKYANGRFAVQFKGYSSFAESLEGIISKRADAPYSPSNRALWVKGQMPEPRGVLSRWPDRSRRCASLARCATARILRSGRAARLCRTPRGWNWPGEARPAVASGQPLATSEMPLPVAPPCTNRFGSPLVLGRVQWVRLELVVEDKYLTWTDENLLRQVVYEGLREDNDPTDVRRPLPRHPSSAAGQSR